MKKFLIYLSQANLFAYAAQAAFYFLLSLFPFLFLVTHFSAVFSISSDSLLNAINYAFPSYIYNFISYNFTTLNANNNAATVGFYTVLALWSSSMFIGSVKNALWLNDNSIPRQNFIYFKAISIVLTLFIAVLIIFSMFATLLLNVVTNYITLYLHLNIIANIISLLVTFTIVIVDLVLVYKFLPPKHIPFRFAVPGSVFSTFGILIASFLFSYYINNIANFSMLYGALGSVVVLLTWLFICSFIIILGGLINAYIYNAKKTENF